MSLTVGEAGYKVHRDRTLRALVGHAYVVGRALVDGRRDNDDVVPRTSNDPGRVRLLFSETLDEPVVPRSAGHAAEPPGGTTAADQLIVAASPVHDFVPESSDDPVTAIASAQ